MAAAPARSQYRRPRPGSLERPVSARMYRGTWLLVGLPLLVAAFSVARPTPLPAPPLPPAFDRNAATALATDLARSFPDRSPGSPGATGAVQWFEQQLQAYGFRTQVERFEATIPGRGRVRLENLSTVAPGSSPDTIVVMAHRDNAGTSPGANDNASGTAALIELARGYANVGGGRRATPAHRILFLSTDGGAFGGLGAEHFALAGAWPGGAQVPPAPVSPVATHWPVAATLGFLVACGAAWLVARDRLSPCGGGPPRRSPPRSRPAATRRTRLRASGRRAARCGSSSGRSSSRVAPAGAWPSSDEESAPHPRHGARRRRCGDVALGRRRLAVAGPVHGAVHAVGATQARVELRRAVHEVPPASTGRRHARRGAADDRARGGPLPPRVEARRGDRPDQGSPARAEHDPRQRHRPRDAPEGARPRPPHLHARPGPARLHRRPPHDLSRPLLAHRLAAPRRPRHPGVRASQRLVRPLGF